MSAHARSMCYSFGSGGGTVGELVCVFLCVGWVCAALSVVGLGALSGACVRVRSGVVHACAELPLSK